jgi:spermidine/putrescine transport system ATP-binding protein
LTNTVASTGHARLDALLHIRGAQRRFATPEGGIVSALGGVDLEVRTNEFLTLLGPSGCGKTTLLRAIAGFEDLDGGEILLGDRSLSGVPAYRRPFNTVFQSYALFPHLTVADNVGYGLDVGGTPRAERDARVAEALALVGLGGLERRKPKQLSGGQQQRVAIARAIVGSPDLILADEPTGALDTRTGLSIMALFQALNREGVGILMVTHDPDVARFAERVLRFRDGRLIADETQSPANAEAALAALPEADAAA